VGADVTAYSGAPGHAPAVPIGQPLPNTQVYLLDQQLEPVPVGVVGEIFVGGPGLARAYLGQADNTALRFVANPFGPPGSRLYRTGDLARYQPDGTLLFAGRADQQLKIRGVRVEPGEVEAALRAQAGVAEAVVVAHGQSEDELHRQLVAYVVGDPDLDVEALRVQLRRLLPEALVPGFILVLPELPRTSTGKLDRKRLPSPQQRERIQHYVPPATVTEALLAEIWADVLHLARVSTEDNFFELGGHSLLATQVVARVRERCGVELPLRVLFNTTATLCDVAVEVDRSSREAQGLALPPLVSLQRGHTVPLSFTQERLWFLEQLGSLNGAYNEFYALQIHGPLNIAALESSLNQMVLRHETLRTHIETTADGQGVQVVSEPQPLSLDVLDLSDLSTSEREQQMREVADEQARSPFVLSHSLFRVRLLLLEPSEHLLLVAIHHIVSDYWSHLVFLRELGTLYAVAVEQRPAALPELPVQYADYTLWQREWLQGEALEQQMSYWRTHLAGSPAALQLPIDYPRPPIPSYRGARLSFTLGRELSQSLLEFGRSQGVTLYMLLLAAFQLLLGRWSRQEDVVVGSPIAGRRQRETEGLIGFFVNTLVLRTDLSGEITFNQLLARVRDVALGAYTHQDLPFEKLVAELDPVRDPSRHPLFQVAFILQNQPVGFFQWPGLQLTALGLQRSSSQFYVHGTSKFDLLVDCVESPDGLWGRFEYSTDLFEASTIERMMSSFQTLLEGIATGDGQQCIAELPLLTPQQKHQVLHTWNQTGTPYPRHRCVHELFAEQAAQTPEAIAAVWHDEKLTYAELEARSNQLAHHLRSIGVVPETIVALCLERSLPMIVGVLGILKAGGAYLPIDPGDPSERIAQFLTDSSAIAMVTDIPGRLPHLAQGPLPEIVIDSQSTIWTAYPTTAVASEARPENLAYVIYTSGSTGIPKGVAVTHSSITRLVRDTNYITVARDDVFLQLASLAFDASTYEIWGALLNGASVAVLDRDIVLSPAALSAAVRTHHATQVFLTTALFNRVVQDAPEAFAPLRSLLFGGEAVDVSIVQALLAANSPQRLLHVYGPTEATTYSSWFHAEPASAPLQTVPIGKPLSNGACYVLDPRMEHVPIGVLGELYLGGAGLARGYLNRPSLTAERFVPDPFGAEGGRLYRTGDLVRYLADGNLVFVGRVDHQVKMRGFRIELGEIEAALRNHAPITECVVVMHGVGERKQLVAYVVAETPLDREALRASLRTHLPEYMVPALFIQLQQMPMTATGKVNRQALPLPSSDAYATREYEPPEGEIEMKLATIWADVLNLERVGRNENFFELGGQSLLGVTLIHRMRRNGLSVDVRALFSTPTIAGLAQAVTFQSDVVQVPPNLIPTAPQKSDPSSKGFEIRI
jgi:amino acid adenylation domain-containing protein